MLPLKNLYFLLDAAKVGGTMEHVFELNKNFDSLYRGSSEEKLSAVAPYIFDAQDQSPFFRWYFKNGWGQSWGILMNCHSPMSELHKHFRKFLIVSTEEGTQMYFRFYDPRVLKIFLPTCDRQQIIEFFGPINFILLEDKEKDRIRKFWHENGSLKSQDHALNEIFDEHLLS